MTEIPDLEELPAFIPIAFDAFIDIQNANREDILAEADTREREGDAYIAEELRAYAARLGVE